MGQNKKKNRVRQAKKEFYVSVKEDETIKKNMKKAGYGSFSSYAREMLTNGQVNVIPKFEEKALKELLTALSQNANDMNRIGNNINQLAKVANSTNVLLQEEVKQMINYQTEIKKMQAGIYEQARQLLKSDPKVGV